MLHKELLSEGEEPSEGLREWTRAFPNLVMIEGPVVNLQGNAGTYVRRRMHSPPCWSSLKWRRSVTRALVMPRHGGIPPHWQERREAWASFAPGLCCSCFVSPGGSRPTEKIVCWTRRRMIFGGPSPFAHADGARRGRGPAILGRREWWSSPSRLGAEGDSGGACWLHKMQVYEMVGCRVDVGRDRQAAHYPCIGTTRTTDMTESVNSLSRRMVSPVAADLRFGRRVWRAPTCVQRRTRTSQEIC